MQPLLREGHEMTLSIILRLLAKRYGWYRIEQTVYSLQTRNNTKARLFNPPGYEWP